MGLSPWHMNSGRAVQGRSRYRSTWSWRDPVASSTSTSSVRCTRWPAQPKTTTASRSISPPHSWRRPRGQLPRGWLRPEARGPDHLYYYPDVQVLCDPTDNDPLVKRRPCMGVEVTSERTEAIDHREKLPVYRGIASLQLYLIVAQDRREVTVHVRDADGTWQTRQARASDSVPINCLADHELSLDAMYQDVLSA